MGRQRRRGGLTIEADNLLDTFDHLRLQKLGGKVKRIVRGELVPARKSVEQAAKAAMKRDPRKAAKAVKLVLYKGGSKSVYGGNINILGPRKGDVTVMARYQNPNPGGKSGIRRHRKISEATKKRAGYIGADRYFVLHWIDAKAVREKRGVIPASNFFTKTAKQQMQQASANVIRKVAALLKTGGK